MNHPNGQTKMTPLGKMLSKATEALVVPKSTPTQKPCTTHNHYDMDSLGVESAWPVLLEVKHVTA